jgi:hypothetical protein
MKTCNLTDSIEPCSPKKVREVCRSTGNTLDTIAWASAAGPDLNVGDRRDGGSNWTMSMLARESHTDVRCLCDARQTSSKIGPAGKVSSVVSDGRDVMDLKKSLSA